MTKISELKARQGKVELEAVVVSKDQPKTFNKFGTEGRVCNAKVKDDSGEVTLTLWGDQCDQVSEGDKVVIHNGWVSEYKGELQLSTGKFGQLEVKGDAQPAKSAVSAGKEKHGSAPPHHAHHEKEPQEVIKDYEADEDVDETVG